jgi:hypothetical protein
MEPVAPVSNSNLETTRARSPKVQAKEDAPAVPGLEVLADAVDGELQNLTTKPGPNDVLLGRGGGKNVHVTWELGCVCVYYLCFLISHG